MSQVSDANMRVQACLDCYICGSKGDILYQDLEDRLFGVSGKWSIKRCPNLQCGLVWLDPRPCKDDLWKAYDEYYTHGEDVRKQTLSQKIYSFCKDIFMRQDYKKLNHLCRPRKIPGKLLEVGCGSGDRLVWMRKAGWEVEGQEVDPKAAESARTAHGIKVHFGELEKLDLAEGSYDVIIMNHVIEHVYDPVTLLTECRRLLKSAGELVVITPNIKSSGHKYFGLNWLGLDPPRHLCLFSPNILELFAQKVGFEHYQTSTTPVNTFVMAAASFEIRCTGKRLHGKRYSLFTLARALFFYICAALIFLVQKDSGEECILRAKK
ncbi:MAG: class I SAM-dependent methyltransferase [Thermodesulfobacteriota bacterium]